MGEVARIVFHQLRDQLEISLCERHIDLAGGCIFGEVTSRRQAPIKRKGLRGARLIARLIEQVTQSPSCQRGFGSLRVSEHLTQGAGRLTALARSSRNVDQAHQL